MDVSLILNLVLVGFLTLGFLFGLKKGTFKVTVRFIYLIVLLIVTWALVPTLYGVVESFIPEDAFESMADYVTKEDLATLAPLALRAFLTPYLWIILAIVTLPIYWIIYFICKKLIIKKVEKPVWSADKKERKKQRKQYKKAKKPSIKSRFLGAGISTIEAFVILFTLCLPVSGAYETLKDDKTGEVRCIQMDDFNSCKYTEDYEKSILSKVISVGGLSSKAFELMSSGKVYGNKASLGEDIGNMLDIYFLLQDNGVDLSSDLDYIKLLSSLSKSEVKELKGYLTKSKFLMNIVDNIGLNVIMNELDLKDKYNIDLSNVKLSKEIGIILDVASMIIELPITKDDKINKNFLEMIDSVDDEFVDDFVASLKESEAIEAVMVDYGKEKIEELVNEALEEYNKDFALNLDEVDVLDEIKIVVNSLRDLAELDILYYNESKGSVAMNKMETIAENIDKTALQNAVNGLFDSKILNQVVDGVAAPVILDALNDSLDKDYTKEDLGLDDINWKEELSNDIVIVVDLINSGVMEAMENDENVLEVINNLENKDELIDDITSSSLVINLISAVAPTYVEEMVRSMMDDPDYVLDIESLDIDWKVELTSLLDVVEMLDGVFEDNFEFQTFISSLVVDGEVDEVKDLADAMTSSKVLMEVIPAIADSTVGDVSEDITLDDVEWETELEPLLRVVRLFNEYGIFEEEADVTNIVLEMLEDDSNIDTLFDSNVVYDLVVSTIEEDIGTIEIEEGVPVVTVPSGGFGYTKEEWKDEVTILSSILNDIDSVEDFGSIGELDPQGIGTNATLTSLSNIIDTLLDSRIFGDAIKNEINELLEFDGEDAKTLAELRTVRWDSELIVANDILYTIDQNGGSAEIEIVASLIDKAATTTFIKEVVESKVKENLVTLDVEGELVFTQSYVDSLDIYAIDWDKEGIAIDKVDTIDSIKLPGDVGFDSEVDGAAMNDVMSSVNQTTVVKQVAEMTMDNTITDMVKSYFYDDVDNPTEQEKEELEEYLEGLNIFTADYRDEFKLLDELNGITELDIDATGYGEKMDDIVVAVETSTIIGPIADKELRSVLDDAFGTYFEDGYFSTLVLSTISWEAELAKKSALETFKDNFDAIANPGSSAGVLVDNLLAEIVAPVEVDLTDRYSIIVRTVVEQEVKDRIKSSLTDSYESGNVTFVDQIDIYNMSKYNSSFEQEFAVLDSIEEIVNDSYVFDISDLNAFAEGGFMYNVANSIFASNILDGSDATINVYDSTVKVEAENLVDGMTSCVTSLDGTNMTYGKEVLKSLFTIE